mmetsp:Transcript_11591/g.43533  ORF Transcript_11591/g.43533 Transcript_11591/m.43533 type:complete len:122 (-) Transcript_11591:6894-7259(-)
MNIPSKYQLRPSIKSKFKTSEVKKLIQPLLVETLQNTTYQSEIISNLTKELSNTIRDRIVSDLGYERYKFVVNVFIGEMRGEGCKMGCRCFWDEECDGHVMETFMNNALFCVVSVFGIYNY